MKNYAPLFRNRNFLMHWLAGAISNIGDFFNSLALAKILSQDPAHLGFYMALVMVAKTLPAILLGPIAGAMADRLPRRTIMIGADLIRAILVFSLVFVHAPAAIVGLVFAAATASVFFGPASSALLPTLVKQEEMVTAGSLAVMTGRMAMLVGNGLGAAVLMLVGAHNVFFIDSASFVLSALLLSFMAVQATPVRAPSPSSSVWAKLVGDMKETAAFLKGAPSVRHLFTTLGLISINDAAIMVLMVPFVTVTLGLGAEKVGIVWLLFGATSVLGALALGAVGSKLHWRYLLSGGAVYVWACMVVAMMTRSVLPSFACFAALGLGSGVANVGFQAASAELIPNQVRGRVYGAWGTIQSLIYIVGSVSSGALADRVGPAPTMLGYATALLFGGIFAFMAFRGIRKPEPVLKTGS